MYLLPFVLATASLFNPMFSSPTPSDLVPRACTTIQPSFISYFSRDSPTTSNPDSHYVLSRTGGPNSNTYETVFRFDNIPAGSTGCQLQLQWPARAILGSGATDTQLYGVQGQVSEATTWANPPVKGTLWASIQFPTQSSDQPYKTIVQSNTCPESGSVSFLLELSDWQTGAGAVDFYQRNFYPSEAQGFTLVYDC